MGLYEDAKRDTFGEEEEEELSLYEQAKRDTAKQVAEQQAPAHQQAPAPKPQAEPQAQPVRGTKGDFLTSDDPDDIFGPSPEKLNATAEAVGRADPQLADEAREVVEPTPKTFLGRAFEVLDAPRKHLLQGVASGVLDREEDLPETTGELIEEVSPDMPLWLKRGLGAGGDVLGDPVTYVTFGAGAAGGTAARAAGAAALKKAAGKELSEEAAERATRAWLGEAVKKGGAKPLSAARRDLAKEVPEAIKHLPAEARGGIGLRVPMAHRFTEGGKEVGARLVPGEVTGKVVGPVMEGLRKATPKSVNKVLDAVSFERPFLRQGKEGYDMLKAIRTAGDQATKIERLGSTALRSAMRRFHNEPEKLVDALEHGVTEGLTKQQKQVVGDVRKALDESRKAFEESGEHIPYRENYFPHEETDELRAAVGGEDVGARVPGAQHPKFAKERTLGPLHEANQLLRERHGLVGDAYITDPFEALSKHFQGAANSIQSHHIRKIGLDERILTSFKQGDTEDPLFALNSGPLQVDDLKRAGFEDHKAALAAVREGSPRVDRLPPQARASLFEIAARQDDNAALKKLMLGQTRSGHTDDPTVRRRVREILDKGLPDAEVKANAMKTRVLWPAPRFRANRTIPKGWGEIKNTRLGPLNGLYAPKGIAEEITEQFSIKNSNKFLDGYRNFLKHFRFLVTIPWPGFHVRNNTGAWFNNWLGGVSGRDYSIAMRALHGSSLDDAVIDGTNLTGRQLKELLENQEIVKSSAAGGLKEMLTQKGSRVERAEEVLGKYTLGRVAMERSEEVHRAAAFVSAMRRFNGDPYSARLFTMVRQGDYGELSASERGIRDVIPFYKFMRFNTPLQLEALLMQPGRAQIPARIRQALEGEDREEFEMGGGFFSPFSAEREGTLLPGGGGMLHLDLPRSEVNDWIPADPTDPMGWVDAAGRTAVSAVTPAFQVPFEMVTAVQVFNGRDLNDWQSAQGLAWGLAKALEQMPEHNKYVQRGRGGELLISRPLAQLFDVLPTSRATSAVETLTNPNDDRPLWERILPIATGVRYSGTTPRGQSIQRYGRDKELGELISELGRRGKSEEFYDERDAIERAL